MCGRTLDSADEWLTPDGQLYFWRLRLPRSLAVMLVGAALAVAGATMQALLTNPQAEPGLLGVSGAAGWCCAFSPAATVRR